MIKSDLKDFNERIDWKRSLHSLQLGVMKKKTSKIIIQIGNKIKSDKDKITGINFNLLIPASLRVIINLS